MGATPLIQQQKVVVTLPAANAGQTLTVYNVVVAMYQAPGSNGANMCSLGFSNTGCGWLSVSPGSGKSPLTLVVTAESQHTDGWQLRRIFHHHNHHRALQSRDCES